MKSSLTFYHDCCFLPNASRLPVVGSFGLKGSWLFKDEMNTKLDGVGRQPLIPSEIGCLYMGREPFNP